MDEKNEKGFSMAALIGMGVVGLLLGGGATAAYFILTSDEPQKPALPSTGTQAAK